MEHIPQEKKKTSNESSERLKAVLDNAVDGIVIIDHRGIIETFNKACERIFGYTAEEVIGQNVKLLMPNPYHDEHDGYLRNYCNTGKKKIIGIGREVQGKRKDGSCFPLDLAVSEVAVEEGRRTFTGLIRDITERKEAEEQQQQFIDKIAQSNEDLERFAYICSHDLQEPLRMIRSYTQKIELYFNDKELDEKMQKYMRYVIEGAKRAQDLITDILAYSRMDFERKLELIQLDDVFSTVKTNLASLIEEKQAILSSPPLPSIMSNRVLMIQLFQNLIGNGIKYTDKRPEITIDVKAKEKEWLFSIQDNGIGIAPQYYEKIFVIFSRLDRKSSHKGTGIGLAICKKIVERHGGKIWLESEPERGSTFFFTLPKHEA